MHEYSIIQALVRKVEAEARAHGALAVHRLRVKVGELSGVEPDLLASAFETFKPGTICERSELEIATVPVRWACSGCGRAIAAGERLQCPDCRLPARLVEGGELVLERIDLEVP